MTEEELKDEVLTLFEEKEEQLAKGLGEIEKIEDEAMDLFDRRAIAIKNKLVADVNIADDELEKKYLEEIEELRKNILDETQEKINDVVKKAEQAQS